jgi:opacity protein-like surface antigen
MGMSRLIGFSAALWMAATGLASAADMAAMPEIPAIENASFEPEFGSNWYLRGDIGYVSSHVKVDATFATSDPFEDDSSTMTFGAGVGYDFGWFRSDLTLDYQLNRDINVTTSGRNCSIDADPVANPADCTDSHSSAINVMPILLNGYFDLGTWSGFTPYVGAGAGVARVAWKGWETSTESCAPLANCPAAPFPGISNKGEVEWNFAWSLMAGISYNLNPNLSIDLGYRFLDVVDGKAVSSFSPVSTGSSAIEYSDLYMHEVRVGFRYLID